MKQLSAKVHTVESLTVRVFLAVTVAGALLSVAAVFFIGRYVTQHRPLITVDTPAGNLTIPLYADETGVQVEVVRYAGEDGHPIEAIMVTPPDVTPNETVEAVILNRGGFGDLWKNPRKIASFVPVMVRLAHYGYVSILPNARHLDYKDNGVDDLLATRDYLISEHRFSVGAIGCAGSSLGYMSVFTTVAENPDACDAFVGMYPTINPQDHDYFYDDERLALLQPPTWMFVGTDDQPQYGFVQEYDEVMPIANPTLDFDTSYYEGSGHGFIFDHGRTIRIGGTDFTFPYDPNALDAQRDFYEFLNYALRGGQAPEWWRKNQNTGVEEGLGSETYGMPEPDIVPTFRSLGISWSPDGGSPTNTVTVAYRKENDTEWRTAQELWYDNRAEPNGEYKGSIVELDPNTVYNIRLTLESGGTVETSVETWSEEFPVARVVELAPYSEDMLEITEGGSPEDGYVVYTHQPGEQAVIDGKGTLWNNVQVKASYVIIRGLTLKNAKEEAINFRPKNGSHHHVVIEDNDISGWGAMDCQEHGSEDAAIYANGNDIEHIIVQRNRIHDPRGDANNWDEEHCGESGHYHPEGPIAVSLHKSKGNHVVRYNEITTTDDHYFNDGIMISGEDVDIQGNNDIYGNIIQRAWDNPIEIEGGGKNVRVWSNYMDRSYSNIAITPVTVGPVYIWRNVVNESFKSPTNDMGRFIKAGLYHGTGGGRVYIYHNTVVQSPDTINGVTVGVEPDASDCCATNMITRNNILQVRSADQDSIQPGEGGNDYDYDLYNGRVPDGQETHGLYGVPHYVTTTRNEGWILADDSLGMDAATPLPNFNDAFTGDAPDMGAYERGLSLLQFGMTPNN